MPYEENRDLTQFAQFTTFEYGKGYQIYVDEECTLTVSGVTPLSEKRLTLYPGWNLIGCPSTTDIPASEALSGIDWEGKLLKWDEEEGYVPTDTLCANEGRFLWRGEESVWDIPLIPSDGDTVSYVYDGDGGRVKRVTKDEVTTYIGSSYEVLTKSEETIVKKHIFLGDTRICTVEYEQGDSANSEYRYLRGRLPPHVHTWHRSKFTSVP